MSHIARPAAKARPWYTRKRVIIPTVVLGGMAVVGNIIGPAPEPEEAPAPVVTTEAPAPAPAPEPTTEAPAPAPVPEPPAVAPGALNLSERLVNEGAYSRDELIATVILWSTDEGWGLTPEQVAEAVDYLDVDWAAEAEEAAAEVVYIWPTATDAEIVTTLTDRGFTQADAEAAASAINW